MTETDPRGEQPPPTQPPAPSEPADGALDRSSVRRRRNWGTIAGNLVTLVVVAAIVYTVVDSGQIDFGIVWDNLFAKQVLEGVQLTIVLAVLSAVAGTLFGIALALMRLSHNPLLRWLAGGYVWVFRAVPLLVQLILLFNIALFLPKLGWGSLSVETNTIVTPFLAAVLAISLHLAAYMCEVFRGGILAVDRGQTEAALAIGLTRRRALVRIVVPQAMRDVVPTAGNYYIDLLKASSLVSVIGARDLLTSTEQIAEKTYAIIELLLVACFWYLVLVTILTLLQQQLEQRIRPSESAPRRGDGGSRRRRRWMRGMQVERPVPGGQHDASV